MAKKQKSYTPDRTANGRRTGSGTSKSVWLWQYERLVIVCHFHCSCLTIYRKSDIMVVVMNMTINELLKEKGMSKYSLSKISGIPWATLSDICSGKTSLARCNAQTLQKLSSAFEMTIEEVLKLQNEPSENTNNGKPQDRSYLETNLSPHLQKAISDYIQGEKDKITYMDCLWGELYGSINADLWGGVISEEQANYLRTKYLYKEEQEEEND